MIVFFFIFFFNQEFLDQFYLRLCFSLCLQAAAKIYPIAKHFFVINFSIFFKITGMALVYKVNFQTTLSSAILFLFRNYNFSNLVLFHSQLLLATLVSAADAVLLPHHDTPVAARQTAPRSWLELEQVRQAVGTLGVGAASIFVEGRAEELIAGDGGAAPVAVDSCQLHSCRSGACRSLQQVERQAVVVHLATC